MPFNNILKIYILMFTILIISSESWEFRKESKGHCLTWPVDLITPQ